MIYLLFIYIFVFLWTWLIRKKNAAFETYFAHYCTMGNGCEQNPNWVFPHAKNTSKSYKCACFYGIQWVKKGENITMFLDIFLHFMPKKKMSKLQIIKVARFSFIPLWDCFELRTCLTGRCLCSQNINKYSNKPAQRVF